MQVWGLSPNDWGSTAPCPSLSHPMVLALWALGSALWPKTTPAAFLTNQTLLLNHNVTQAAQTVLPRRHALFQLWQQEVVVKLIDALHVAEHLWNDVLGKVVERTVLSNYFPVKYLAASKSQFGNFF